MKKVRSEEKELLRKQAIEFKRIVERLEKKHSYLGVVSSDMFQYTFLKAQAREIYNMYTNLKLSPFKSFFIKYKEMVTQELFLNDFYLLLNEYGELVIDEKRLKNFLPTNTDETDS